MTGTCFLCLARTLVKRIKTGAHGWQHLCRLCALPYED